MDIKNTIKRNSRLKEKSIKKKIKLHTISIEEKKIMHMTWIDGRFNRS